jgi:DNA-binding IscR family transcriptional regulator
MTGVSGPGGGYALAKPARKITLAAIVQAVEGPIEAGVLEPVAPYQRPAIAKINLLCEKNAVAFRKALSATTLEQLARAGAKKSTKKKPPSRRAKSRPK